MSQESPRRIRVALSGIVQGVGFRPFVHRLAASLALHGFVRNDSRGVELEVEGFAGAVARFLERLPAERPPLARIDSLEVEELSPTGACGGFAILGSAAGEATEALISPDIATCDACLAELRDPSDRRFRYPFINCTDCGPRFTIVRGVPYDRALTTMAGFTMCDSCRAEYEDPANRRFHAQPNACPVCGPRARLVDAARGDAAAAPPEDAVRAAAAALRAGAIVAVKGLGGYHLACRADDVAVVATLRRRKGRDDKPFALMARDVQSARRLVRLGAEEEAILSSRERPIVLAARRSDAPVADAVAAGRRELGVMLPYTPLHHLLLADAGVPLVMTSGNVSDEPIAYDDAEAAERLRHLADLFLLHDRPIGTRTDDSVVRVVSLGGARVPMMLRRSRGYVPLPFELPDPLPRPVLACGPELKCTFAVGRGRRVWVGHHIGDLENYETLRSYREGIAHFERICAVAPETAVHDLHPDYLSTAYAREREGVARLGVQHHHAHLAACLAEHGARGSALGVIYDGTGYGPDGTVWGGELLAGDARSFERVGHLWPVRMPGGAAAIREPWRMACAWLVACGDEDPPLPMSLREHVDAASWAQVARLARGGFASPVTTSAGRLFDAVAALLGLRARVTYEGQAAAELEAAADPEGGEGYALPVVAAADARILDARALIRAARDDAAAGLPAARIAARFHDGLADGTVAACLGILAERGLDTVVLSGGVFQNVRLLERMAAGLAAHGVRVLVSRVFPPNDGGVALGQASVAAASP